MTVRPIIDYSAIRPGDLLLYHYRGHTIAHFVVQIEIDDKDLIDTVLCHVWSLAVKKMNQVAFFKERGDLRDWECISPEQP